MPHPYQKCEDKETPGGRIRICSFCSPDEILPLSFDTSTTKYARYSPIISRKETLAEAASRADANVTLAVARDTEIAGFGILRYPHPDERWVRLGERLMMEVAVIEVGRQWRGAGVSRDILHLLTDHPLKEDRVFYMVGYSWTWDLEGMDISPMDYRDMMIRLFSALGFEIFQTNEPNIIMRPENLFMARIGANISEELRKKFKLLRFNLD